MIHILCVFLYFITEKIVGPGVLQNRPSLIFFAVVAVVAVAASLALHVRRWHDLGKSGAWALTYLIPVIAAFGAVMVFGFENQIYLLPVGLAILAMVAAGFSAGPAGPGAFGHAGSPGLLGHRQTWAFFWGKLMTDGIWWFYLFWLPDYLVKQFHMKIHDTMWPTFIVYGISIIGSVYGGSIPMTLMKRGLPVYQARMTAMLIIAVCPLAVLTTQYFGDVGRFGNLALVYAVAVICIGAAAHQAWSANLFTTVSDMFPKRAVGSVTGIGALGGGLGGGHCAVDRRDAHRHLQANPADRVSNHVCPLRPELPDRVGGHEAARAPASADYRFVVSQPPLAASNFIVPGQRRHVAHLGHYAVKFFPIPAPGPHGSVKMKLAPGPGLFSARIFPPCASIMVREMARPMPMPLGLVV